MVLPFSDLSAELGDQSKLSPPLDLSVPFEVKRLEAKSGLVTGGASGLGESYVRALAGAGAWVTFTDINPEAGKKLEDELNGKGQKVQFVVADVTDWEAQVKAFKAAISFSKYSSIDVVIPNAGVFDSAILPKEAATLESDPVKFRSAAFDINVLGALSTIQLAYHYFTLPSTSPKPIDKSIIIIGSLLSYFENPTMAIYNITKYAIRGVFKALRTAGPSLSPPVRANMINPAYMKTNFTSSAIEMLEAQGTKFGEIEDVANLVLRLAGDGVTNGRSIVIADKAVGCYDIRDDWEGLDSGKVITEYILKGNEAGVPLSGHQQLV